MSREEQAPNYSQINQASAQFQGFSEQVPSDWYDQFKANSEEYQASPEGSQVKIQSQQNASVSEQKQIRTSKQGSKRKKSAFHNFQKHLVTTIRRHMKLSSLKKRSRVPAASLEIWRTFLRQKFYTKQFLLLAIGDLELIDEQKEQALIKKYKLAAIFDKYDKQDIESAQDYLKYQVIETMNSVEDRRIVYKRRINKQAQFIQYTREFIRDLENRIQSKLYKKQSIKQEEKQIKQTKIQFRKEQFREEQVQ